MQKTVFKISKMDCPSEENLIRMKLNGIEEILNLEFDIPSRKLIIYHDGKIEEIERAIFELNLGGEKESTEYSDIKSFSESTGQTQILWIVLIINFAFFMIEITAGLISGSMGLVADSLDMLADAFVYGISLYAVGGPLIRKKRTALTAGYFQMVLAAIGIIEVVRRFISVEKVPDFSTMIIVSFFALIANAICLNILQRSKSKEAHMQASMIFTSNDVIINIGVIAAAVLVRFLNSGLPDLIIGTIVFILVVQGAVRILKLGK